MSWEKVKLGDIAEFSNGVNFDKSSYAAGVKLISVSNFGNRFYPDYSELSEIRSDAVRENDYLQHGDIVFVRSNGNKELVGRCMLIDNPPMHTTFSGFCIRARVKDTERFNPRFLTYHFKHNGFRIAMSGNAVGANIQNLSQGRLSAYIAYIPPIETQRRIADILSAYDDLIENNRKQIKLLEEAAQRLYKEWFVDLRFPGHEHSTIVDGVPEGWKIDFLSNVIKTTSGGTPARSHSEYYVNGSNLWVKTQELTDGFILDTEEKITDDAIKNSSAKLVSKGSILMAMYGATIGKLGIATQDLTCNQACCVFDVSDFKYGAMYLFCWLLENRNFLIKLGKGAAQSNLSQTMIKNLKILVPCTKVLYQFSCFVDSLYSQILTNQKQVSILSEARDRLLPKLMSGEVEV